MLSTEHGQLDLTFNAYWLTIILETDPDPKIVTLISEMAIIAPSMLAM